MSSHHDFRSEDAFTRSNTATPDSGIHLSDGIDNAFGSRKRKRADDTAEDLLKDTFVVRPYPPKAPTKTHTLQPLALLPRSQLSLSSLDVYSTSNPLPPSRLFEAHVKVLELEQRMGNQAMIVIARLDDGRTLYAVEREDRGLYAIFKLGSWVNLHQLRALAAAALPDIAALPSRRLELDSAVHSCISLQPNPEPVNFSKKKRLAIEAIQSMVKRPTTGLLPETQILETPVEEKPNQINLMVEQDNTNSLQAGLEPEVGMQTTIGDVLENIRNQYFDALYLSKASLAYFAKGPLSRARAAFHLDYESSLDMNDLITFVESLVLPISLMDKKYKDGLPSCISLIDIEDHSGNDASKIKIKRKRNTKKMKPGKNGLYPNEDEIIRKWWISHEDDFEVGVPGRTREDLTKSRLAHLRIRETQLQLILILEVLALKPLASAVEDVAPGLPGESQDVLGGKIPKLKKAETLAVLMDVHIDRLCIWQSLSSESTKTETTDSQITANTNKHTENITRDFCVDIVAPFFSARLPEQCAVINKKLGGPVNVPPPKRKLMKSASVSGNLSRPGAATKRPVPAKPKKSLTRILSDERERERRSASAQPNRKISLLRSATMPAMPGFKREGSEISLSSIPSVDSQTQSTVNKSGFTNSKRFGHREVDFASLTRDEDAKAKKQASINDELKSAIAALKKPNRELAGKNFADTIEQRTMPLSISRKSKKPVRNPLFQSVQISATPKTNRQTDVFAKSQGLLEPEAEDLDFVPPSSLPRVPQSSFPLQEKKSIRDSFLTTVQATPSRKATNSSVESSTLRLMPVQDTPLTRNTLQSTIQATPSRKSTTHSRKASLNFTKSELHPHPIPQSPLHVRRSSASLFTSVPDSAMRPPPMDQITPNTELSSLEETPVKKRPGNGSGDGHSHPASGIGKENRSMLEVVGMTEEVLKTPEESIYKSLGWDDGDDLDELA